MRVVVFQLIATQSRIFFSKAWTIYIFPLSLSHDSIDAIIYGETRQLSAPEYGESIDPRLAYIYVSRKNEDEEEEEEETTHGAGEKKGFSRNYRAIRSAIAHKLRGNDGRDEK